GILLGLTGRKWVVLSVAGVGTALVLGGGTGLLLLAQSDPASALAVLGWVGVAAVAFKAAAAVAAAWAAAGRRLLHGRTVGLLLAAWLAAVLAVFATAWWLLPAGLVPAPWLACAAVLLV